MQKAVVLRKNKEMVTRIIDGETILMPIYKSSEEINCIYTLNKAGSEFWNLIDGKRTLGAVKKQILEKFDATPKDADKEMGSLLKDLKEIKAIEEV